MRKLCFILVFLVAPVSAQQITVSSSVNDLITKGVTVSFAYQISGDNPFLSSSKTDSLMAPVKSLWLWGDEAVGEKRNATETDYGATVSHVYKKPGIYAVVVIVTDKKNRMMAQESIRFKISKPFEIVLPEPVQPISRPE